MRIRLLLCIAMLLLGIFAAAQYEPQSQQQTGAQPSAQQPMSMPQQSAQPPVTTPQTSAQQPMSMSQPSGQEATIRTAEDAKFKSIPGLPECVSGVVQRGDPKTGPYVAYVKETAGCTIPWHWHTANEQVMYVSGTAQLQMKGEQAQTVGQGAYANIPSKHQHQLTCPNGCTYYLSRDGAADIHYVDAAGNEISPETALAAVGEHPATSMSARQ